MCVLLFHQSRASVPMNPQEQATSAASPTGCAGFGEAGCKHRLRHEAGCVPPSLLRVFAPSLMLGWIFPFLFLVWKYVQHSKFGTWVLTNSTLLQSSWNSQEQMDWSREERLGNEDVTSSVFHPGSPGNTSVGSTAENSLPKLQVNLEGQDRLTTMRLEWCWW